MKFKQLVFFYILMVVIPTSNVASVLVASQCHTPDNRLHSIHTQMNDDGSMHEHFHDQMLSQDSNDHANCDCGCDSGLECSVSGCSAFTLTETISVTPIYTTQSIYTAIMAQVSPVDPNSLYRPPISLS